MSDLDGLIQPKAVAVYGASRTPGKVGNVVLKNLVDGKFPGTLVPINPGAKEVLGLPCFPSLTEYGKKIDLSIIVIPARLVISAVRDSIKAGVRAICVISAGFKEVSREGAELEKQLAGLCATHRVRLLGPNCLGLFNTQYSFNGSFANHLPTCGNISLISQSGAVCTAILDWAVQKGLGISKMISIGNKADLAEDDFLEYLKDDPDTKVIIGYLESINSGDAFVRAAQAASLMKPAIILKSGVTEAGSRATSSHTGSLAGADIAYGTAFKRSGVIRAHTFEELFDYATAFQMQPLPRGRHVAVVTNAGGPGIMATDAIELSGLKMCQLTDETVAGLASQLPEAASTANPIDVLGDAGPELYGIAIKAALNDKNVDAIVVILTPQAMTQSEATARAIAETSRGSKKPVLAAFLGGVDVQPGRDILLAAGIPDYPASERAVAALKVMYEYADWLKRPSRIIKRFAVNRRRVERIIARDLRSGILQMGEAEAKDILRAYGFYVSPGKLVYDVGDAISTAQRIGFPVAMKIASPDVIHKSDIGGVKLHLNSPGAVEDAFELMMLRVKRRLPEATIQGAYLERMCPPGREVILGMTRDPQFGPMLMFGLGGIFVEVMKDVTFNIAPITEEEAMRMLESTRSFALLKGVRGQQSVDLKAIAGALQRISQLVTDFPQIKEMDINPFIVGEIGADSYAADARITLSREMGGIN